MLKKYKHFLYGVLVTASIWGSHTVNASGDWPIRPIKWVLPYLPGTAPDTSARILAEAASAHLGQPVIVENRAGASGNIGARWVAKADPDGYTWLYSAAPMAASMVMYKEPGYDAINDFKHITQLTTSDVVFITHPKTNIKTVSELVEALKDKELNFSSGGVGTPSHFGVELFLSEVGAKAMHIPYKGASELVSAVMGQQVDFGMPILSVAGAQVRDNKLNGIAVGGKKRNSALPNVPTFIEQGYEVVLESWGGLSLPKGVPSHIAERIHEVFMEVLQDAKIKQTIRDLGSELSPSTPEDYVQLFYDEIELTKKMMERANLTPQ